MMPVFEHFSSFFVSSVRPVFDSLARSFCLAAGVIRPPALCAPQCSGSVWLAFLWRFQFTFSRIYNRNISQLVCGRFGVGYFSPSNFSALYFATAHYTLINIILMMYQQSRALRVKNLLQFVFSAESFSPFLASSSSSFSPFHRLFCWSFSTN